MPWVHDFPWGWMFVLFSGPRAIKRSHSMCSSLEPNPRENLFPLGSTDQILPWRPLIGLYIWPITFSIKINRRKSYLFSIELKTRTISNETRPQILMTVVLSSRCHPRSPRPHTLPAAPFITRLVTACLSASWITSSVRTENLSYPLVDKTPQHLT